MLTYVMCVHLKYVRDAVATKTFKKIEYFARLINAESICFASDVESVSAQKFYLKMGYTSNTDILFVKKP